MCLGTHSILQHIIMYISTHLYIYLHASYSHIHVTKPRTCNNTTNMYQCCRYVTILRICNNTTNTYIYRCYNNSIYNTTSLPYLQRWTHIPEHTYYTNQRWNTNIYPQCPSYTFKYPIHILFITAAVCEVIQPFMAFKNFPLFVLYLLIHLHR